MTNNPNSCNVTSLSALSYFGEIADPLEINAGYAKFKVVYAEGPFKIPCKDGDQEVEALTDFDEKVIKINEVYKNTPTGKEMLLHELLHVVVYISGINTEGDSKIINIEEEDLVVKLTTGLLTLINLNPCVFTFNTSPLLSIGTPNTYPVIQPLYPPVWAPPQERYNPPGIYCDTKL